MNKWQILVYKTKTWEIQVDVKLENETIWLSQNQISEIFWVDRSVITRHISNIFKSWEINKKSNVQILHIPNSDKPTQFYNLDIVLAIWYRVNTSKWIHFRKWANKILKDYIIKWYSINQNRLKEKWLIELEQTLWELKKIIKTKELSHDEAIWLLEIITNYWNTWILLQKYDKWELGNNWKIKKLSHELKAEEALKSLDKLKEDLIWKKEASQHFAIERQKNLIKWIFWNIYQTFWWKELYKTVEEKAAHLLYFVVKNHPFIDWNKRSWAFLFILFLIQNKILLDSNWEKKINERALVAITLLIAESDPKNKEIMVNLVINLIC